LGSSLRNFLAIRTAANFLGRRQIRAKKSILEFPTQQKETRVKRRGEDVLYQDSDDSMSLIHQIDLSPKSIPVTATISSKCNNIQKGHAKDLCTEKR